MKRLLAFGILLSVLLAGCMHTEMEDIPTAPEITDPYATEEPFPTLITEPILP